MSHQFSAAIGKYPISFETGKLAGQAGGAVTVSCGDTLLLATATMSRTAREGIDFFPLRVDYEERLYAAGRIPGSFFRREGRPHEGAILTCRLVDRPIRPLFPKGLRNEVQIIITALSHDQEHQIDILAILGASAALTISDIPSSGRHCRRSADGGSWSQRGQRGHYRGGHQGRTRGHAAHHRPSGGDAPRRGQAQADAT